MRADVDLPWYWGTGPSTWAGDAGLRSSLGPQIDHLLAGQLSAEARRQPGRGVWRARPQQIRAVDSSQAEDAQIERLAAAERAGLVEARLRQLGRGHVLVLELHYLGGSLPYSVDPACRALVALRRLVGCPGYPTTTQARKALLSASVEARERISAAAIALVVEAKGAYELAEVALPRRVQIHDPRGRRL